MVSCSGPVARVRQCPVADVTLLGGVVEIKQRAHGIATAREGDHATVHGTVLCGHSSVGVVIYVRLPQRSPDLFDQSVLLRQKGGRIVRSSCNVGV